MQWNLLIELFAEHGRIVLDNATLIERLVRCLVDLSGASGGSYWRLRSDSSLRLQFSSDIPKEKWDEVSNKAALQKGKGLPGLAVFHGNLVRRPSEFTLTQTHDTTADRVTGSSNVCAIAAPVLSKGQTTHGALYLFHRDKKDAFSEAEEEVLELGAKLLATVLKHRKREDPMLGSLDLIGKSKSFLEVMRQIQVAAKWNMPILLLGETGTGKSTFVKYFHDISKGHGDLVEVNCGSSLDPTMMHSELFGHVKGSFTGASSDKAGAFERASDGTLFLEEVGNASLHLQRDLLRVLDRKLGHRLGETIEREYSVRIVAATNLNLKAAVATGEFREDLYYRLMENPVTLPPLRERRDDIPLLAKDHLVRKHKEGALPRRLLCQEAINYLSGQWWPGNIRQLFRTLSSAAVDTQAEFIDINLLRKHYKMQCALSVPQSDTKLNAETHECLDADDGLDGRIRRAVSDCKNWTTNGKVILKRVASDVKRDPRTVKKRIRHLNLENH